MTFSWPNPNLIVVQSRLAAPSYWGPGRWLVINPTTRDTYVAHGADTVPGCLDVLANMPHSLEGMSDPALGELLSAGILQDTQPLPGESFWQKYHRMLTDYPAEDYSREDWRRRDRELMREYADESAPPPRVTEREGPRIVLPCPDSKLFTSSPSRVLSIEMISAILALAFAPIGDVPWALGVMFRKTSPSGGARHPTECILQLYRDIDGVLAGAYYYDVERHALVSAPFDITRSKSDVQTDFGLLIASRVERAMWRYRDPWAFRPVLIDAGHVIATVALGLAMMGWTTTVTKAPNPKPRSWKWTDEPLLFGLQCHENGSPSAPPGSELAVTASEQLELANNSEFLTNPTLYMRPDRSGLLAEILWPTRRTLRISTDELRTLTHCLPSRRGDRRTSVEGCVTQLGVSSLIPGELARQDALLPIDEARDAYSHVGLWSKYGWYLSMLQYGHGFDAPPWTRQIDVSSGLLAMASAQEILNALRARHTTRVFERAPVSAAVLCSILGSCVVQARTPRDAVFVYAANVAGLCQRVYEWRDEALIPYEAAMNSDVVRDTTIRQAVAAHGSVTVWFVRELTDEATYEWQIAELGVFGQQLCVAATRYNLGIFLTPAVFENQLCDALNMRSASRRVAYVFTIGHERRN